MATGALDANGIWIYGEDDNEATHSDLLNLGQEATSDVVGDMKARLGVIEDALPVAATTWTALTYSNSWTTFPNSAYGTPGYRRTADGMVIGRGLIAPGTLTDNTVIATLPAGFRPAADRYFLNVGASATVGLVVGSNGQLRYRVGTGTPTFLSLDMVRFYAEQ